MWVFVGVCGRARVCVCVCVNDMYAFDRVKGYICECVYACVCVWQGYLGCGQKKQNCVSVCVRVCTSM